MKREYVPYQGDDSIMAVPYKEDWASDTQKAIWEIEAAKQVQHRNTLDNLSRKTRMVGREHG